MLFGAKWMYFKPMCAGANEKRIGVSRFMACSPEFGKEKARPDLFVRANMRACSFVRLCEPPASVSCVSPMRRRRYTRKAKGILSKKGLSQIEYFDYAPIKKHQKTKINQLI